PLAPRTVAGLLVPEPMPLEPEAIAAVPGLSPFGFIETENGRPMPAAIEACQQAEPPLKAKVEHLLEAARHLAGAGYEEEAKIFRVEAEAIQNASHRLLAEKRQELERLQREISELEALTGQYAMIQIDCRVMEFCVPQDCDVDADLSSLLQTGFCAGGRPCSTGTAAQLPFGGPPTLIARCSTGATSRLLSGDELAAFLHVIENHECGTLKTLAEPCIVTTSGRPATLHSGGEFPIMIPVAAKEGQPRASVQWRDFGLSMQAVPFVLGNGKVRLKLETELSDRDFSNAVNLNGTVVPGLTTRRFNNDIEAQFGETVAIACNSVRSDEGVKSLVLLVTVRQVEPAVAEAEHD
ncbi:MAG: hypothetical protein JNG89_19875, partial [Planctomycetaceae bacterium]|nr:hypothetical protein [Planctomycetaceae bacterium]